jgi:hypothetical protein
MIELGPLQSPECQWNNGCSNVGFLKAFPPGAVSHRRYFGEVVMRKWGGVPGLALTLLILTSAAFGQGGATGALSGVVQDKSGSGIVGARVVVLNESTKEVLRTEKRLVQFALCYAL